MKPFICKGSAEYRQAIMALFLGSFITFAALYGPQPLIATFAEHFHVTAAAASLIISLPTGLMAAVMLLAAWLSDAAGRKRIMTISLFGTALLLLLSIFCREFEQLLVVRTLLGLFVAGFPPIALVYVSEEFDPAITGLVTGIYISGNSIGGLTGRVVVSTLTDLYSWQLAMGVIGILGLVSAVWFWRSLPESRNFSVRRLPVRAEATVLFGLLRNRMLVMIYIVAFLLMGGFSIMYNYIGFVLLAPPYGLTQTAVGAIFIVYLVGTVSSTLMGRIADHTGKGRVLFSALAIMLAGTLLSIHPALAAKVAALAIFTFGFFGAHSVAGSWAGQAAFHDKAQSSALYMVSFYLGTSILGAAGGFLLEWFGWTGIVLMVALIVLAAIGLTLALLKYCPGARTNGLNIVNKKAGCQ